MKSAGSWLGFRRQCVPGLGLGELGQFVHERVELGDGELLLGVTHGHGRVRVHLDHQAIRADGLSAAKRLNKSAVPSMPGYSDTGNEKED